MIKATQMTLFDSILFTIDPNMNREMRTLTDELWKPDVSFTLSRLKEGRSYSRSIHKGIPYLPASFKGTEKRGSMG